MEKRFQFLREIVQAVRRTVGNDFLFGIRRSAVDFNYMPVNIRWPVVFPLRHYFIGNTLKETLYYGQELEKLGVDYRHISSGFGFINPTESPGDWPVDEFRLFANGGFQRKSTIEATLTDGTCDWVSMARPLLATPDLLRLFQQGIDEPPNPCNHCNRCSVATAVLPLGCYDRSRFPSQEAMEA